MVGGLTGLDDNYIKQPGDAKPEPLVKSMYWECEAWRVDKWRPFTALLDYNVFSGPSVRHAKGIDLNKNLVAYAHGPRGGTKTLSMSYWLAKEMRLEKPVWTNYPISFYVQEKDEFTGKESDQYQHISPCHWINADNTLSYYESMPLDMDKFYTFDRLIRNGAVGIDELQYFVEARTSGKYQNRVASYQIMQIRKTANSFFYTVQNPTWVDKRFGWSTDYECKCTDLSTQGYDRRGLGRDLEEGELGRWVIHDLSGIITGQQYQDTGKDLGPYQFEGHLFWDIYPTHFIIDPEAAATSADNINPAAKKNKEKADRDAGFAAAVEEIVSEEMALGNDQIATRDLWDRVEERGIEIPHNKAGEILRSMGIIKTNSKGEYYSFAVIRQNQRESE
jgi:hypothetical protein